MGIWQANLFLPATRMMFCLTGLAFVMKTMEETEAESHDEWRTFYAALTIVALLAVFLLVAHYFFGWV